MTGPNSKLRVAQSLAQAVGSPNEQILGRKEQTQGPALPHFTSSGGPIPQRDDLHYTLVQAGPDPGGGGR